MGGNGQLGKALSVVLGNRGIDFRAWGSEDLDIRSALKSADRIRELRPLVIVNSAAWTDVEGAESNPDRARAVNTVGASNLAAAAKAVGAIFVQISTDYVFSGAANRPWQEDALCVPSSVYGATKAAGEVAVMNEYAEHTYIFRTAWLFSQWGKNFAKTMTRLAFSEKGEVAVVRDQVGQPTWAMDLAVRIVDSVLEGLPFGIYHATNSGEASWFDFARKVFELSGASVSRVVPITSNQILSPVKRPMYSVLGHDKWTDLPPMRNWESALKESMPDILEIVKKEDSNA